jgi:hypothetical protein
LRETGLPRPCHLELPAGEIVDIRMIESPQPALLITPRHGMAVTTLRGERADELRWTARCLRIAIGLAPPIVQAEPEQ